MILLVLLVVVWIVVLAPSVLRRVGERRRGGSIDHFHHQLQLLEHAGPKTVSPAYRLESAPGAACAEPSSTRPRLVLLRPVHDGQSADIDDVDGMHYARVGVIQSPESPISTARTHAGLAAYRRHQARQRCTLVLRVLAGVAILTGILGAVPSFHMAWIVTGVTGLPALGLVGLIAYARDVEEQGRRRSPAVTQYEGRLPAHAPAPVAYPVDWDGEADPPLRQAAAGR